LVALVALSEGARNYVSEEEEKVTPYMDDNDAMMKEISGEEKHAAKIIARLKTGLKVANAVKELGTGEWWDRGPVCDLKPMLAKFV
jgi:hypothetical protein